MYQFRAFLPFERYLKTNGSPIHRPSQMTRVLTGRFMPKLRDIYIVHDCGETMPFS